MARKPKQINSPDQENSMINDELLTLKDVIQITKMSKSTIYKKIQLGEFPQNRSFGSIVRWSNNEVQRWIRGDSPAIQEQAN